MEKYAKVKLFNGSRSYKILSLFDENTFENEIDNLEDENDIIFEVEKVINSDKYETAYIDCFRLIKRELTEMSRYRLYPIYRFSIKFKYKNSEEENWKDNSICHSIMYRESKTNDELDVIVGNIINGLGDKYKFVHPLQSYEYKLLRYETWCLDWFSHYTFDNRQSDSDLYESFERYVRRYEYQQNLSPEEIAKLSDKYVCLMGAEDRWRWGHYLRDDNGEMIEPEEFISGPCRCNACKKSGIIRIEH